MRICKPELAQQRFAVRATFRRCSQNYAGIVSNEVSLAVRRWIPAERAPKRSTRTRLAQIDTGHRVAITELEPSARCTTFEDLADKRVATLQPWRCVQRRIPTWAESVPPQLFCSMLGDGDVHGTRSIQGRIRDLDDVRHKHQRSQLRELPRGTKT